MITVNIVCCPVNCQSDTGRGTFDYVTNNCLGHCLIPHATFKFEEEWGNGVGWARKAETVRGEFLAECQAHEAII